MKRTSWMGQHPFGYRKIQFTILKRDNQLPIDAMPSSSKVILVIRKPSRCVETLSLDIISETIIVKQYINESGMLLSSKKLKFNFEFEYKRLRRSDDSDANANADRDAEPETTNLSIETRCISA